MDWTTLCIAVVVVVLCIAPSVAAVHRDPALRTRGTSSYLTATAGRSDRLTPSQRRVLWKRAASYILRVIRLRKKWHSLGIHLQQPRIQSRVQGVSRQRGHLIRVFDADSVARPRAKTGAQQRRRSTAAAAEPR